MPAVPRRFRCGGRTPPAGLTPSPAGQTRELSFRTCAQRYIAAHEAGWRNPKHRAQWPSTLERYAYPVFGDLPVASIDTALVTNAIEPIWNQKPETASRVRGRIEAVLDWATAREYRQGENPARWRGHLDKLLPARAKVRRVKHHTALPYDRMPDFMTALRAQGGVAAQALQFLILTAARTSEVIGARACEIRGKTWTVPAERMKGEREHRVPLRTAALAIVEAMSYEHGGEFVFPGGRRGKPLSQMALAMTLRRMGRSDLTVHGFRSTFRDWAAERTGFPREAAEAALAHVIPDKVEAAYRRGDLFDRRRQLMQAWDRYCASDEIGPVAVKLRRAG